MSQRNLSGYTFLTQSIHLDSVVNARELGGYLLPDGRKIRKGMLMRGSFLNGISMEDADRLRNKYNISLIFDFRTEGEVMRQPDRPFQGCKYVWLPAIDPDTEKMADVTLPKEAYADLGGWLVTHAKDTLVQDVAKKMYPELVMNEYTQLQYTAFLQTIVNNGKGGVYWHCSQGKDRTGIGAAVLLAALGADRELILKDFELSNEVYQDAVNTYCSMVDTEEEKAAILTFIGVNTEYFTNALNLIDKRFGSLENYLRGPLCLNDSDIDILRERYTE